MKLLGKIADGELPNQPTLRQAARAVLLDENGQMPLLFVAKYGYHKLPGGGVDEGETPAQALAREAQEEVGAEIEITGEVGEIVEVRTRFNLRQVSFCYLGKICAKGEPHFTQKEKDNGFRVVWLSVEAALAQLEQDETEDYEGKFILERDRVILRTAQAILGRN